MLLKQATEFLESMRLLDTANTCPHSFAQRHQEIASSIQQTGTYWHTTEELEFGAKLAWRNSNRCIGRHYWRQLDVFDCRETRDTDGVFKSLENHLHHAFNDGAIRSSITIFPPQPAEGPAEVEILNHQLIRYAFFQDSEIGNTGDPANADITELALENGWRPKKRDRFVPLPWMVQVQGQARPAYDVFANRPDLLKEVSLEHPENGGLKSLELKWHAIPVISDMALVIGGIVYPCAPFNGWYMGTEIGARNLADVDRYDCLADVGRVFGLDMSSDRSLWRDRAIVELNRAVLHSFDRDGVSIGDHHSLTQQFDKFCKSEAAARCPVTGDWSWLVPPMTGSQTPTFFQEFDSRETQHTNFFRRHR